LRILSDSREKEAVDGVLPSSTTIRVLYSQ